MINSNLEGWIAAFGGLAVFLVQLAELRTIPRSQRPDLKDWLYWLPLLLWPFLGFGLAFIYKLSNIPLSPILALNIGASAPLIIRSLSQITVNPVNPGEGA